MEITHGNVPGANTGVDGSFASDLAVQLLPIVGRLQFTAAAGILGWLNFVAGGAAESHRTDADRTVVRVWIASSTALGLTILALG